MRAAYSPIQQLCLCWPLKLDTPCTWNYYPSHISSRRDELRLSCLLTQALMPLESIANLNCAIWLFDYITFSLTCGLRTVYLINLKNLICVDIAKCQVKCCLLLVCLHIHVILFLRTLASSGGPNEIRRRAECGPGARVGQHCPIVLYCLHVTLGPQPLESNFISLPHYTVSVFPGYWDWLRYPRLPLVFVSIALSPSPSISRCFSIQSLPTIGFHQCFFFTTDVSAPIRSTLHLLMVSFQAWDWLWYTMLWSKRRSMGCT